MLVSYLRCQSVMIEPSKTSSWIGARKSFGKWFGKQFAKQFGKQFAKQFGRQFGKQVNSIVDAGFSQRI